LELQYQLTTPQKVNVKMDLQRQEKAMRPPKPKGVGAGAVAGAAPGAIAQNASLSWEDAWENVADYIRSAQPQSTKDLYERYQNDFKGFVELHGFELTGPGIEVWIAEYMRQRATGTGYGAGKRKLAPSTISSVVSGAIADLYRFAGIQPPTRTPMVTQLKKALRRLEPRASAAKEPLPIGYLKAVLMTCYREKTVSAYRDAVIMLVMFSCWLRQSEVMRLKPENVKYDKQMIDGKFRDCVTITVEHAKNDQERKGSKRTVPKQDNPMYCLYSAMKKYDEMRNKRYKLLVYNMQCNLKAGNQLSRVTATHILRRRLLKACPQFTKEDLKRYASNSLRKAGVTAALAKGADRLVVQLHGGWLSAQSVDSYYVPDKDAMGRMMDSILNGTEPRSDSDSEDGSDDDDPIEDL